MGGANQEDEEMKILNTSKKENTKELKDRITPHMNLYES